MGHADTTMKQTATARALSLDEYWMPFTPNRDFKHDPKMVVRAQGGYTVPQIFIGATHVGGCDDLYALDQAGKLDPLLNGKESAA